MIGEQDLLFSKLYLQISQLVNFLSQTIHRFTPQDAYPLPRIDNMVEKVSKFSIYSSLDLRSAYHQIPLQDEDKKYTTFESGGNLYHFVCMPFGITNGVAGFQRVIDSIIETEKLEGTFAYVDNITVCGDSQAE